MIQTLLPWALCVLVLLVSLYQREQDRKEREQLVNRIMAKDYGEYTIGMRPPPKPGRNDVHESIKRAYKKAQEDTDE